MSSRRASTSRSLGLSGPNSIGRGSAVPGGNGKCSVSRNSLSGSGQPLLSWQISAFVYAKVKFQTAPKQNPRVWDGDQPDHGSDAPHVTTSRICAAWKDIPRPAARFQVPSPGVPAAVSTAGGAKGAFDLTCSGTRSACCRRRWHAPSIWTTTAWRTSLSRSTEDDAPFGESSVQSQDQGPFFAAAVGQPE